MSLAPLGLFYIAAALLSGVPSAVYLAYKLARRNR